MIPKFKKGDKISKAIFDGDVINTPSMICVEDYLDALDWAGKFGLDGLIKKSQRNLSVMSNWVAKTDWIEFLADDPNVRYQLLQRRARRVPFLVRPYY